MIVAATEEATNAVLVAPAIISVCGVLIIGGATLWLTRKIHLERLAREESTIRREAFTRHVATQQERPSILLAYEMANEKWEELQDLLRIVKPNDSHEEAEVQRIREKIDDRLRETMSARDEWATRALAAQYAAIVTVPDERSSLLLTVKLPVQFPVDHEGHGEAMELFIESLRIDAIINQRKRKRREKDLVSRLTEKYSFDVLFGSQEQDSGDGPSRAGHDSGEPGGGPGDRQTTE